MNEPWGLLALLIVSSGLPVAWGQFSQSQPKAVDRHYPFKGIARFLYFVGIPYAAVLLGLLTLDQLGLTGLSSFNLIDWSGNLLLELQQATTLMLLSWLLDSGMAIVAGGVALLLFFAVRWGMARQGLGRPSLPVSPVEITYHALHWAFYRAIFWGITGDLYLGVVLGVVAVFLEWLLIIKIRGEFSLSPATLLNGMILLLTATAFFYSPNLWLLLPFHWGMVAVTNRRPELEHAAVSL